MKVTLERTELLKSLTHVHRVVERRNTIPILSNVMLQAEGGDLKLKATDLDLEVTETISAMVEVPGSTTVPAHMIYEIVRKLPDGSQVVLETSGDESTMEIRAGRSRFSLQILPVTDFPDVTAGEFTHAFKTTAGNFRHLTDCTQFAISTEETRYYLNGIFMHTVDSDGKLRFRAVATDGHRLAQAELDAPEGSEGMPGIIVPRKCVGEIQKLMDEPEAEVLVEISETKIRFTIGSVVLTSKLIDGSFPDYGRVIPKNNDKELLVDRDAFKAAVDRVSTIASERGRAVKLSLSEGKLVLTVTNPDSGTATEELAVEYNAEEMEIGFNSKYLLDIAAQLETDSALFRLADSGSPTLIQEGGDTSSLYVLMPMRV
ncbi:DNA polymerase III subunit beta [Rhodobacteraceae bacterium RKSG542]|uniref:DNA polymerase III subunit beta n=1 Tax=Pseudovibrio flavus TaxID=2529854 RepID=UPI0012BCF355|nr:DNA polymerase III subunit beta [Pseudovibrio flavus]MTI18553.1 DNA polymerase III subunit beta [Pseudovibrio flavus]